MLAGASPTAVSGATGGLSSERGIVERSIAGYHQDGRANWVAELDCGHNQHLYHRPPFQLRPWVLEVSARTDHLGTPIDCPLCDRAELPEGLRLARRSPEWVEATLPAALKRAHRVAGGHWGRLLVLEGRVLFRAATSPPIERCLAAGASQPIPPTVSHDVTAEGPCRLMVEFLDVVPFRERPATAPL